MPYKNVYTVVNAIKNVGVEVVDVLPSEVANYYAFKNKDTDSKVVSLIDIGCEKTNVSVFNKGIIVKNAIIPIGSNNIDLDISNSYNLPIETAKDIKEIFAVGNRKYADSEEYYDCLDKHKASVRINQYQLAEIIEMRTIDILKNAKIETNNLTKREIGYIMVTGGISSILGFTTTIEDLYPKNASSMNINIIGIRDNRYSSVYGAIKYFCEKLALREKEYSMFDDTKIEEMLAQGKKMGSTNVLSKIFGKIFD